MENTNALHRPLFRALMSYNEVVGAATREQDGRQYIVIYLSRLTESIQAIIPSYYDGIEVITELKGAVRAI
jgi:hypothetical protein